MSPASRRWRRSRRPGRPLHVALVVCAALLGGAGTCSLGGVIIDPNDLMLHLDPVDPATGQLAEIVPYAPWVTAGPDGELGTEDDIIGLPIGDADLALRTGIQSFSGPLPAPHAGGDPLPFALAEPFASGIPVDFVVSAVDGHQEPPPGPPVVAPSLEGVPVLVMAFADLDGDGWIGITHLDGDPFDAEIEDAELMPVGRRLTIAHAGRASGSLHIAAAGPSAAPLTVVLTAAAYIGSFDPAFFNGVVPTGPAVMTRLPFVPRSDPDSAVAAGNGVLLPADPATLAAVEIEAVATPDPADPRVGEAFTLHTDGSDPTTDGARVVSGSFSRLGFGLRPEATRFRALPSRPLRPGLDDAGTRVVYEVLQHLTVDDDGSASQVTLRVLPLDRLGNVADLVEPVWAVLHSEGALRIVSPDQDGDPWAEALWIDDARGATIVIDDLEGQFDDPGSAALIVEGGAAIFRLDIFLPDPDVDDSGLVGEEDIALVEFFSKLRFGDPGFEPRYDLNGDGRIDKGDVKEVRAHLGESIPTP